MMYFYILVNHRKVSFGRMIGCDNENCPTEWFHFPCVGLDDSLPVIDCILIFYRFPISLLLILV
jgi:hypothetical protein